MATTCLGPPYQRWDEMVFLADLANLSFVSGTYISFHGLIMINKQVCILPLTPFFPCNDNELHNRVLFYVAFGAACCLLALIKEDAASIVRSSSPQLTIHRSHKQHPNISSLLWVFSDNGQAEEQVHFQITNTLMMGLKGKQLLYLASITDPNLKLILIKFTRGCYMQTSHIVQID